MEDQAGEAWRSDEVKKLHEEFRSYEAGQFVLRLYKEGRQTGK